MRSPERVQTLARRLREDMSLPEVLLWDQLRKRQLAGARFRRQHPVGPYVLDFYCPTIRMAVEVDGAHHYLPEGIARDRSRDAWLAEFGVSVLRIPASDILARHAFEGVLRTIEEAASARLAVIRTRKSESKKRTPLRPFGPPPPLRRGGLHAVDQQPVVATSKASKAMPRMAKMTG